MYGSEETILGHILREDGRAYTLRHSCLEIAETFSVGMRLRSKRCGPEGVLSPLLNPVVGRLAVFLGVAHCLPLLIEGFTDEAMCDV